MLELKARGKKGIWQIRGTLCGERVRESTHVSSRPHAEIILAKKQQEILDRHTWGEQKTATFAEAAVLYLGGEEEKDERGRPKGKARFMSKILDHFGRMRLADITSAMVAKFAADTYPKAGAQGKNRQVYTPIISVFRAGAHAQPPICSLPSFKRPEQPKPKGGIKYGKDEHIAKLLLKSGLRLKAAILTITFTAARASEACRVEDEDIDWEDCTATFRETKTGEPRVVKLPPIVMEALIPLRGTKGPLFGFKTRHSLNQAIKRASERAKVPYLSSHKIGRHAFAARLLREGHSQSVVMDAGGWKQAHLFNETYKHLERSHIEKVTASSGTKLAQLTTAPENVIEFQANAKRKTTMSR